MLRIIFLLTSLGCLQIHAQDSLETRILFVGNSYTYFWNLPQSVQSMAVSQGYSYTIRQSTAGGSNLGQHWRGEKSLESVEMIRSGEYDVIILQDHSMQAINHPDSLMIYMEKLGALAEEQEAESYLYMTWSREWNPFMLDQIKTRYTEASASLKANIVPVGPAWDLSRELRPDLQLYHPDGSHPSPTGTYLSACVMFSVLTGQSPVGLPARLTSKDIHGEKLYLNIQTEENALFLQQVAWQIVQQYRE